MKMVSLKQPCNQITKSLLCHHVGDRSRILKFPTHHQDPSMEYTSNEGKGVHLHTLVDRERKRSSERG